MLKSFIKKGKNCATDDARFLYLLLLGREPFSAAEAELMSELSFFGATKRLLLSQEFFHATITPFFVGKRPMQLAFDNEQSSFVRQKAKSHFGIAGGQQLPGLWPQCLALVLQTERAQKAFLKAHTADRLEYLLRHLTALQEAPAIIGAVHQNLGKSVGGFAVEAGADTPLKLEFFLNGKPAGECVADQENRLIAVDLKVRENIGFSHDLSWEPEPGVQVAMVSVFEKTSGIMICPPKEIFVDVQAAAQLLTRTVEALNNASAVDMEAAALNHQATLLERAVELPFEDYDLHRKLFEPTAPPSTAQNNRIGILLLDEATDACSQAIARQSYEAMRLITTLAEINAEELDFILPMHGTDVLHPEALAWINEAASDTTIDIVRFGRDFEAPDGLKQNPVFATEFDPLILKQKADYAAAYAIRTTAIPVDTDFSNPSKIWNHIWRSSGVEAFTAIPVVLMSHQQPVPNTALQPLDLSAAASGKLAVIIPTKNRLDLIKPCVESLQATLPAANETEIIIVDNGSDEEETVKWLSGMTGDEASPNVTVLRAPEPFNWAALNNKAAAQTDADLLLFLNDDTKAIEPGWDQTLRSLLAFEDVGVVGAKLLYASDAIQHAGVILKTDGRVSHEALNWPDTAPGYEDRLHLTRTAEAVTGAFLACSRKTFEELGGFDEENFAVTYNDIDFCLRASDKKRRTVYSPLLKFYHLESQSRGHDTDLDKRAREKRERAQFLEKWPAERLVDRYFPPQLQYDNGYNRLILCRPPFRKKVY